MEKQLFASALRELLKGQRSQRWLCSVTRLSRTTVNRLASGAQEPAADHLKAIATAFPDWQDRRRLVLGRLYDVAGASGDARRIHVSPIEGQGEAHPLVSPQFDGSLRLLAEEILDEALLPEDRRTFTKATDILVDLLVELRARRADARAVAALGDKAASIEHAEAAADALEAAGNKPAEPSAASARVAKEKSPTAQA